MQYFCGFLPKAATRSATELPSLIENALQISAAEYHLSP
jgi:hypothetical protein